MAETKDEFAHFEHEGWQRVADKYDSVWSSLTRQFIPYLIDAAQVLPGMSLLDVACGPGYVSDATRKLGAIPMGIDFSEKNGGNREENVSRHPIHARRRSRFAL